MRMQSMKGKRYSLQFNILINVVCVFFAKNDIIENYSYQVSHVIKVDILTTQLTVKGCH